MRPALCEPFTLELVDQGDHRAGVDAHRSADLLLNGALPSPEDVQEREKRRCQADRLERRRGALVRYAPKPEEELTGELGHFDFIGTHNSFCYKLYVMSPQKRKTKTSKGFTAEERAAMKEHARELKAEASRADGEKALLAKIAEMPPADRAMAKRLHAVINASAPALSPKTWYGMPAYANADGKVVCYFQSVHKFKSRYATFGFNDSANLDQGAMWPTSFALKELTAADEAKIGKLVKKAVS